jgi:hypothetical protein
VVLLAAQPRTIGNAVGSLGAAAGFTGYEFHCLQNDVTDGDRFWLDSTGAPVALHDRDLGNFADTAALINQMDVIVTIGTAIVHLAGALAERSICRCPSTLTGAGC